MPRTSLEELALRPLERWTLLTGPAQPSFPPTFMVGPPRAGTTVAGLHALAAFELAYVPNVSKAHKRTALVRCMRALRAQRWEPSYDNAYGKVEGELAPSDGWDVFDRFFEPYTEARAEHAASARGLRRIVAGFERAFDAPFFTKNNANSMRVEALAALFPGALFVHVTRSYPEAAASLLEARSRFGVALGEWWSAAPPQHLTRAFSSEIEQVAFTLRGIDEYLRERLPRVAPGRHLELDYERFCERPAQLLEWLEARYAQLGVGLRRRAAFTPRERFEARRLAPERRAQLERELALALERRA
ncbi:MAG: sulfotransferase [Planctomycetes bacterium]|nr:sulfotransferase [Planctomycetota bacterium]